MKFLLIGFIATAFISCSRFQAERVNEQVSDEKALSITDNWVLKDTEDTVKEILKQMKAHPGYQKYLSRKSGTPAMFIAEVQNKTSEAYFPIDDWNAEFLNTISYQGDFTLVDAAARKKLLEEITYQNDGMVDPATAKQIGKQTGADLLVFGSVNMNPESRDGKTIKQYSVNIHITDIEKGTEILRTRTKVHKYSSKSKLGW